MRNIEIGIDLGTTNSEIAIIQKGEVHIVKNSFGDLYTPSVVGINKAKNFIVGKKAYEALNKFASDEEFLNNKAEIKRLMGSEKKVEFKRINRQLKPEEISAEILKSLKADVLSTYKNVNTKGVVITVPAYFSTVQAEATRRAGLIAGFSKVLLLQEPIAAAISYGFNNNVEENWLVYDLGGGTFDVALISSKNGNLHVLEHKGDNFLGGKDIDLAIIDTIVIPYLKQKYGLVDFYRGNQKYNIIFQKIKYSVEQAKIQLSRLDETEIECDFEIDDQTVFETLILSHDDLKKAALPLIKQTIKLCKETIKSSGLDKKNINRIILVGGPTQLTCVREELEKQLEIYVDATADPLTAVATGACIFASGQKINDDECDQEMGHNTYKIILDYEALSAEEEELIVGEIPELKNSKKDYFIQVQNVSNTFVSDKIKLQNGKFKMYVPLEERKLNSFWLYLIDSAGMSLSLSQDSFNITQGLNVLGAPLPKSIGLSFYEMDLLTKKEKNIYEIVFAKNSILPLSKTIHCQTAKTIRKGQEKESLGIYIYEGESSNVDRNMMICSLEIKGEEMNQNIAAGSNIEVKLTIDESRSLNVTVYLPEVNQEFDARSSLYDPNITLDQLENEFKEVQDNFKELQNFCDQNEFEELDDDMSEVQRGLYSAKTEEEEKYKVQSKLKKIKLLMDALKAENVYEKIQQNFCEFEKNKEKMKKLCIDESQEQLLNELFEKGKEAQKQKDSKLLSFVNNELSNLNHKLLFNDKSFLLSLSADLYHNQDLKNNPLAQEYFEAFAVALKNSDMEVMKDCIMKLIQLLPRDEQEKAEQKLSGIKKI